MTLSALALIAALVSAAGPAPEAQQGQDEMWDVLGHFDAYPHSEPYAVADALEARGAAFRTAGFATEDSAEKVLAFYRRAFERDQQMVFEQPAEARQFFGLSAYDAKTHIERTVVVLPGNGGLTHVVLSISDGDQLMQAAAAKPADQTGGLPVHPSARPMRSDAIDGSRHTTSVSYRANVSTAELIAWLMPPLAAQGWVSDASTDDSAGQTLHFRRGAEALEIVLVDGPAGAEVTYLHLH